MTALQTVDTFVSANKAPSNRTVQELQEVFDHWFEVIPADTPELEKESFRLRYQVYCVENEFEDPADNPDGLETDFYDQHSVHSLLIHRLTGDVAGSVRLVLPRLDEPNGGLPIHQVCSEPEIRDESILPLATTAEISRFAISKQFRRRREDGTYPNMAIGMPGHHSAEERRMLPHMTLGLLKGVMQMSHANGITHWSAVLEPALLRLLSRMGLHLNPIGPIVSYHGRRQSAYADIAKLAVRTRLERPDVWELCSDYGRLLPNS